MQVIGDLSRTNARRYPDKVALRHLQRSLTYAELDRQSNQLAHALIARGVKSGDRVALLAQNCLEYAIVTQGVAKAGAILMPINFRLASTEIAYVLGDGEPRVVLSEQGFVPALQGAYAQLPEAPLTVLIDAPTDAPHSLAALLGAAPDGPVPISVDPQSACALMYTSGTTGFPKGVLVSHAAYFHMYFATAIDIGVSHQDVYLMAVPMFHMAGLNLMLHQCLFLGATGIIHRGSFDCEAAFGLIAEHRVTTAVLIPTIVGMMARHPRRTQFDLSSLRTLFYGSMPMPPAILHEALEAFPEVRFHQLYGSTEAGMLLVLAWDDHAAHPYATGREALLSEVRVLDAQGSEVAEGQIGEVLGGLATGMMGYWRNDAATRQTIREGWIHTGDLARRESAGFYSVVGRIKEVIISGGENIYPVEVERVLAEHPAVREVAVLGLPDPLYGESVCAALSVRAGSTVTEQALDAFCRERLAGYKRPRRYAFYDALPRNASDKVQKNDLRAQLAAKAG